MKLDFFNFFQFLSILKNFLLGKPSKGRQVPPHQGGVPMYDHIMTSFKTFSFDVLPL
eukprot:UN25143